MIAVLAEGGGELRVGQIYEQVVQRLGNLFRLTTT
jgi:hypothetical protein